MISIVNQNIGGQETPTIWKIEVDWNRDGAYTKVTEYVTELQRFLGYRTPYMGTASDAYLHLTLHNAGKRFTPENSSGPLSAKLAPLRPVRIQSNDGTSTRTHWSGWIAMILPVGGMYGIRQVDIIAHGAMQFLKATETKIELQENQRSDQIIDALIQEVIFPPALRSAKARHQWLADLRTEAAQALRARSVSADPSRWRAPQGNCRFETCRQLAPRSNRLSPDARQFERR